MTAEDIITLSKIIGAAGIIFGAILGFTKWLAKQEKQSVDIEKIEKKHDGDIKELQEELCVVNYAVLASLDALIQSGYCGKVSQAHDKLQKHINKKAHGQEDR